MSDQPPEPLPCATKLVFDTKKSAEASATALKWRHGSQLIAYRCHYCQLWHLSSS